MKWKLNKTIFVFLSVGLFLLLIWGVVIEPRLIEVREETAVIPNLPDEFKNKKIALIADLQVGMWFGNEKTVKEIIRRIIEIRPAAVLIAGDFVYKPTDNDELEDVEREDIEDYMVEVNKSIDLIRPLTKANIPTFAVLGNHDYGMSYPDSVINKNLAEAVRKKLISNGIKVLDNQAVPLKSGNGVNSSSKDFHIIGIGSSYAGNAEPAKALSQIPTDAPRLIFMHNPEVFKLLDAKTAPIALAGHTHGGQIRIPFTENLSWMALFSDEEIHADGWIGDFGKAGNNLYVNRGIGFSSFPVRINCRPELTVFTLKSGKS